MRILITAPSLDPLKNVSGISTVVNEIIQNNREHDFYHYLVGQSDACKSLIQKILTTFFQLLFLIPTLVRNRIQLVHQNVPLDKKGIIREALISFLCFVIGVPVILHIHGGKFILQGTKNRLLCKMAIFMFRRAKRVIVLSGLEKSMLSQHFAFPDAEILPNSIATQATIVRSSKKFELPIRIMYMGRIEENKGIKELMLALTLLKNDGYSFCFSLCGTGPLVDEVNRHCSVLLGDSFDYHGIVFGSSKMKIISESHVFVLPSYFEGIPMSLIETMAGGVVPVITNVGSVPEVVTSEFNGLLVKKKDPNDLFEKLKYLLSEFETMRFFSQNARSTIVERFSFEKYISQLNKVYQS